MAIASRVRASASTYTFVATGPTTLVRRSMCGGSRSGSGLELGLHARERLADHLVRGAFDHPCPDARQRAGKVDVGRPVHDSPAVLAVGKVHLRRRVHGAAWRLAVGLDQSAVG